MTIAQVLELEKDNWDKIYLFPVGGFYKAYEHSACLFHTHVRPFKASKRFVKSVNRDVVSLGFPIAVTDKWLYGMNRTAVEFFKGVFEFTPNLSKNVQTPLGLRLKTLAYDLVYAVRRMYEVKDRAALLDKAVDDCEEIKFLLEMLCDMRQISVKAYALSSERIVSVSKQLSALRTRVKA